MLKNYFTVAWRNLFRNKLSSAINIIGLAIGLSCSLFIFLWVKDEKSVDGFHANGKYLYQVYERDYFGGNVEASYPTQGLLGEELKRTIPEIQRASGFESAAPPGSKNTFERGDKVDKMEGMFAGTDFFSMFTYPLLEGTPATALSEPGTIAISTKMAGIFFGSPAQAIGQNIRFDDHENLKVSAVFENIPQNSSQQFEFLRTWSDFVKQNDWVTNWGNTDPSTYVQLRKGANPARVGQEIKDFIYHYTKKDESFRMELALQPFGEKYLHSNFKNGFLEGGRIEYVRMFSVIAVLILMIACINFMNLATAQSAKRAKEVGLRKVVGARRSALVMQFIGESILLTFFSISLACLLTVLLLPAFNYFTSKSLAIPIQEPYFWISMLALAAITGIVAGSYPAVFLSSLSAVKVLKGALKFSWKTTFLRKGLVVLQFALSIFLIISMIVVNRQMHYIQTKNIGYDRQNLLYIPIEGSLADKYNLFKQQAAALPGVVNISKMRNSPTVIMHHTGSISWPGKDPNLAVPFADGVVGYDFVKTMKLQLVQGRDFSPDRASDSSGFLLNETAVAKIGLKNPVGQRMSWGNRPGLVIGVIKDFHFNSLHQPIDPLIIRLDENWNWGTILVRLRSENTSEVLSGLGKICKDLNPAFPFTYQFSDLEFAKLYKSEQLVSALSNIFAFLAIFISCMGLFALALFSIQQRAREISVRKVHGASVSNIVGLLFAHFLKPVGVAFLVAAPLAWLAMDQWLRDFSYKIRIEPWMFLAAGSLALLIALATISYQAVQAALVNPVKNLRNE